MNKLLRRDFLAWAAMSGAAAMVLPNEGWASSRGFELEETTIDALQQAMARGEVSSRSIVTAYIARIKEIDPRLNSVVEINPDALTIAAKLDRERRSGRVRGPMHGIPVLIKDNIDTADSMKTTAGSLALLDAPAPREDSPRLAPLCHCSRSIGRPAGGHARRRPRQAVRGRPAQARARS